MRSIRIPVLPVDAHVHFREGERLHAVAVHTAGQFGYAIVMPNLAPKHITSVSEALAYREVILRSVPSDFDFTPLMTTSLTTDVTKGEFRDVMASPDITAVKLYAGHTTNASGVDDLEKLYWAFEMLEAAGKPLLLHGEANSTVDVFDREKRFYETEGSRIVRKFSSLKVVCEHITTEYLADFVLSQKNVFATITSQHLLSNRNDMLGKGGIRPDFYCMPILKQEEDRLALLAAATSGNPKFFLGTDSAPHPRFGPSGKAKYSACGCAGCFTAPHALELYAEAFAGVDKLYRLSDFASKFGHEFYGLEPKKGSITINEVNPWKPPESYWFGDGCDVASYVPHETLKWKATRFDI